VVGSEQKLKIIISAAQACSSQRAYLGQMVDVLVVLGDALAGLVNAFDDNVDIELQELGHTTLMGFGQYGKAALVQ
jgi:hypothetical protein